MREGAVVLMDCLGYKGIWNRSGADPDKILAQFTEIRANAEKALQEGMFLLHSQLGMRLQVSFLSDTVVITVDAPHVQQLAPPEKGRLIHAALMVAQKISNDLLQMAPPLAVRGCAVYGRFEMSGNFMIGPAIDEAAELHELADGAFLWIPPHYVGLILAEIQQAVTLVRSRTEGVDFIDAAKAFAETSGFATFAGFLANLKDAEKEVARQIIRELMSSAEECWNMFNWSLPLKGRGFLDCRVIGPIVGQGIDYDTVAQRYNVAMSVTALDVLIKRQNTLRFLSHVKSRMERANAIWAEKIRQLSRPAT